MPGGKLPALTVLLDELVESTTFTWTEARSTVDD